MSAHREEVALWLLDALAEHRGVNLELFCPCSVEMHFNRDGPVMDLGDVVEAFRAMARRGEIEFERDEKVFMPHRRSMARLITTHRCWWHDERPHDMVHVSLTPVGGRAWERAFQPDWSRRVDCDESGREIILRCPRRDVLERVLRRLPRTGLVVDGATVRWSGPTPFRAPGWRDPEAMHVVRFAADGTGLPDRMTAGMAIESVCPVWCSPWSAHVRYYGRATGVEDA